MARYGVNILLTKYNNPTSYTCRILINNKSYYHPYVFSYSTGYSIMLTNSTTIGGYTLELSRSLWYLRFAYKTKAYTITFTRGRYNIFSVTIQFSALDKWKRNVYIYRLSGGTNFQTDYTVPNKFKAFISTITGTSLSELYRKYLPILIEMMK